MAYIGHRCGQIKWEQGISKSLPHRYAVFVLLRLANVFCVAWAIIYLSWLVSSLLSVDGLFPTMKEMKSWCFLLGLQ